MFFMFYMANIGAGWGFNQNYSTNSNNPNNSNNPTYLRSNTLHIHWRNAEADGFDGDKNLALIAEP